MLDILKRPAAFLPIAMSLAALATVLIVVAIVLVGSAIWGWRGTRQG